MRKELLSFSIVALIAVFWTSTAGATTIKGTVAGCKGCTVVAVAKKGSATSAKLKRGGSFLLKLKSKRAKGTQLEIIKKNGNYLGPIVLKRQKNRAYLSLQGESVNLGKISIKKGYALVKKELVENAVANKWAKTDSKGKPRGAGKLGLDKRNKGKRKGKKKAHIAETKEPPPGDDGENKKPPPGDSGNAKGTPSGNSGELDSDRDGIPKQYDVDNNANGIIDSTEKMDGQRSPVNMFSNLKVPIDISLNLNATGIDKTSADDLIKNNLTLVYEIPTDIPEMKGASSVDVDCMGLPYCRAGNGTAIILGVGGGEPPSDLPLGTPWAGFDTNSDGLPNLYPWAERQRFAIIVNPTTDTSHINPGDSYNFVATTKSDKTVIPSNLDFYFFTTPGLTSYDHGSGPQPVTYPVIPGSSGTQGNPIQMISNDITLTFWRPQRPALPGESGSFYDIGGLMYGVEPVGAPTPGAVPEPPPEGPPPPPSPTALGDGTGGVFRCKTQHYTNLSPTLKTGGDELGSAPLVDTANDAAPNAANTLSFTLKLGECLQSLGVPIAGQQFDLDLQARTPERGDNAAQKLTVKMPG